MGDEQPGALAAAPDTTTDPDLRFLDTEELEALYGPSRTM